jgi:hypothetical protein
MNRITAMLCAGLLTISGSALAGESMDESTNPNSGAGGDIQQQRMQDSADKDEYKSTDTQQPQTNTKESMIKGKEQKHGADEGGVDVNQ